MIPYINHLLDQWGIWCVSGRDQLGYPRQAAFLNGQPSGSKTPLTINDDMALQVQRAVNHLEPGLRKLLVTFYVRMRSADAVTIGKACGCGKTKLYDELHRAHVGVMFWIQEDELKG